MWKGVGTLLHTFTAGFSLRLGELEASAWLISPSISPLGTLEPTAQGFKLGTLLLVN